MANASAKPLKRIAQQKLDLRRSMWPDFDESQLWHRATSDGWLSVPRALPLILRIMDTLAPKGKPVSQTYFDLWCRTYDDSFVIVSKPREMAFYSGFSGERAQHTWTSRIEILEDLSFIEVKAGVHGRINYILLFNPYFIIKAQYKKGKVSSNAYNALRERAIEIGADDLNDERQAADITQDEPQKAVRRRKTKK